MDRVNLKLNIQKTKIMAFDPITSWKIDGETVETVIQSTVYTYNGILLSNNKEWTVPTYADVLQTVPIYCKSLMLRERSQTQKLYTL